MAGIQWAPGVVIWAAKFAKNRAVDVAKTVVWLGQKGIAAVKGAVRLAASTVKLAYNLTPMGKRKNLQKGIDETFKKAKDTATEIPAMEEYHDGGSVVAVPCVAHKNVIPVKVLDFRLNPRFVIEEIIMGDWGAIKDVNSGGEYPAPEEVIESMKEAAEQLKQEEKERKKVEAEEASRQGIPQPQTSEKKDEDEVTSRDLEQEIELMKKLLEDMLYFRTESEYVADVIYQSHYSKSRNPADYNYVILGEKADEIMLAVWHNRDFPEQLAYDVQDGKNGKLPNLDSRWDKETEMFMRVQIFKNALLCWFFYEGGDVPFWDV